MNIVYIDGHCLICNRLVDFLLKRDLSDSLHFASLQGEHARNNLPASYVQDLSSVVLKTPLRLYTKSSAAIRCLALLGGWWRVSLILLVIPKVIRDHLYTWIAVNRYKIGGELDVCPLILKEDKSKILD